MPYKTLKTFLGNEKEEFNLQNVLKLTITIFLLVITILSIPLYLIFKHDYKQAKDLNLLRIENKLQNAESILKRDFFGIISNVVVLADAPVVKNFLNNPNYKLSVESLFKRISSTYQRYDQIRLLDLDGNELIRVDYIDQKPVVIEQSELQNKKNRDYFKKALELNNNEILVTDISLNIENNVVEIPYQPVIRVATSIYNKNGNKVGVLIFNYNAQILLDNLALLFNDSVIKCELVNKEGYYLFSNENEKLFGDDINNNEQNIKFLDNEIWQKRNNDSQLFEFNNNLELIKKVFPLKPSTFSNEVSGELHPLGVTEKLSDDYYWYLLLHIQKSKFDINYLHKSFTGKVIIGLLILLSFLISFLISSIINIFNAKIKQNDVNIKSVKKLSETDELTNISNRRHFFELARNELSFANAHNQSICLMMIDIDHFKKINDIYGHAIGDKALINLANIVQTALREGDIFARLGGEEFVILCRNIKHDNALGLANRVITMIEERYIDLAAGKIHYTISIGLVFSESNHTEINQLLNYADVELYKAKNGGRNRVVAGSY